MANNIMIDEGTSGKYAETVEITSNIHRQTLHLAGIGACRLKKLGTANQNITCTNANTDYTITNPIASTAKYLTVYSPYAFIISMGEATSATCGVYVGPGMPTTFPVTYTGVSADDRCHVQSPTAGTVVRVTEMSD